MDVHLGRDSREVPKLEWKVIMSLTHFIWCLVQFSIYLCFLCDPESLPLHVTKGNNIKTMMIFVIMKEITTTMMVMMLIMLMILLDLIPIKILQQGHFNVWLAYYMI